MSKFYDALETRPHAEREAALLAALPRQIQHARTASPAFASILADIDPATITSRAALAGLPVTRKYELLQRQQEQRAQSAFGGFATHGFGPQMPRVFASPGTIYEPEGTRRDYWRMARAIHAAGFRTGELIHNCFSYHFVPAGSMMETGAHALGCTVFAGGTGQTEQQVQAMAELQPAGYIGTPSFLKIILEKAHEMGVALPSVSKALVSGEAFPPSLRDWLAERGVAGYQCYATADLGLVAYETSAREGLVLGEDILVEIVRPGTGDPVAEGEVGELVVTTLRKQGAPLIRYRTHDFTRLLKGDCPCGRSYPRIDTLIGRTDDMIKVKGVNICPGQIDEVLKDVEGASSEYQVMIDHLNGRDIMTLFFETDSMADAKAIELNLQNHFKAKVGITIVPHAVAIGELPRSEKKSTRIFDNRY